MKNQILVALSFALVMSACGERKAQNPLLGSGLFVVQTIADEQDAPLGIAVDEDYVYWSDVNAGLILKSLKEGGEPEIIASGQDGPTGVVVNETHIFWTQSTYRLDGTVMLPPVLGGGTIMSASKTSGEIKALATGLDAPWRLTADSEYVYWGDNVTGGSVLRVPVDGGATEIVAENQSVPHCFERNGGYLYWANFGGGTVSRAPITGGDIQILADGQPSPDQVIVHDGFLYWSNASPGGGVMRVPQAGGAIENLAPNQPIPHGMAIVGEYIYWTNLEDGTIRRTGRGGGEIEILAENQSLPDFMIADHTTIYWTNFHGDSVMAMQVAAE